MNNQNLIKKILENTKTIVVVGLSDKQDRPSYEVASYLKDHGYTIIPVNPMISVWNGLKCYPDLLSVPRDIKIDVVDIFRKPEFIPEIVDQAIKIGVKVIWMQEGIVNEEAKQTAKRASLAVVMNRCMMKEHKKLNSF
ncbi:CoA-binding protein [Candidatus Gottesmanbacteria bacterium]|nr:CoA-binding protein [Candidatus Gottesmanbacteria bacterium]